MALVLCVLCAGMGAQEAYAQDCSRAGARGAAPSSWQTYCWLNMTGYNDAQARSGSGQNLSYNLPDGSRLTFRLRVTNTPTNASAVLRSATAPSWNGAAVGNSSFLNIPGRPILYQATSGSTTTLTITNIAIVPPPGVTRANQYAFVVADAESTDNSETQQYSTNGGAWQLLDRVAPISGSQYPTATGLGTTSFRAAGAGQTGRVGAYIVSSLNPTSVTITMEGAGLQGVMLAIRFASITLSKTIEGPRIADNDQFRFLIESSDGAVFAQGQTSGTDRGPFPAAVFSFTTGVPLTLREEMVAGSTNTLADYRGTLTCTNINTGSSTVLPRDAVTQRYDFGALQFGDFIDCIFTNIAYPKLELRTVIASSGRIFATDQFQLTVRNQDTNSQVAAFTTTGTGTIATPSTTGRLSATAGTTYRLNEAASGTANLSRYGPQLGCTNRNTASATVLPSGGSSGNVMPRLGDVITCTITNTRDAPRAILAVDKTSRVISDPTGNAQPKAIPGAIVEYTVSVTNSGDAAADANTLRLVDTPDADLAWLTAFAPVFTNGSTTSGLSFNPANNVAFSNQTTGNTYSYTPASPSDPAVARIRFSPTGSLRASDGTAHPSFTLRYRVVIE